MANNKKVSMYIIAALVFLAAAIILISPGPKEDKSFSIEDKCGNFMNLVSHTITDEEACSSRCKSQCISINYGKSKIEFKANENGCNSCTCYCE